MKYKYKLKEKNLSPPSTSLEYTTFPLAGKSKKKTSPFKMRFP